MFNCTCLNQNETEDVKFTSSTIAVHVDSIIKQTCTLAHVLFSNYSCRQLDVYIFFF